MEFSVRRATGADTTSIQRLYIELVGADANINVDPEFVTSLENDPSNYLIVAESAAKILGTAFITICRDVMYTNQPFALVENIVVTSSARSKGIGKALMAKVKAICKEQKCTKIMLLSNANRTEAHKFFEQNGYRGDLKRGFVNYINR